MYGDDVAQHGLGGFLRVEGFLPLRLSFVLGFTSVGLLSSSLIRYVRRFSSCVPLYGVHL